MIDLSKNLQQIYIIEPIYHYQTPIGALIAEINIENLLHGILPDNPAEYYRLYAGDRMILSRNYQENLAYIVVKAFFDQDTIPQLYQLKFRIEMGQLESEYLHPVRKAIYYLIGISGIFLLVLVFVSLQLGNSLARPLLQMVQKAKLSEENDSIRFSPIGTGDELEILAEALDLRDGQLRRYRDSLEEKVEARTQELTELNARLEKEILERRQTGRLLEQNEARIRAVVENLLDGIITINTRGIVETFTPAAENIFGYPAAEVVGQNVKMLMPEPYHSQHNAYLHDFLINGIPKIIGVGREVVGKRKDGTIFPMDLSVSVLHAEADQMFVGVVRDISDRKMAEEHLRVAKEEAESASRSKSEFLANMSHEIRTPLNAVIGMAEVLSETEMTEHQRKNLHVIRNAGESLLELLNDILDLSKIEAGQLTMEQSPFAIRKLLEMTSEIMSFRAHQKNIELISRVAPEVPQVLLGDASRLRQILINLIGNAIKFTEKGEILLTIELNNQRDKRVELLCSVSDTGIGISPEHQMRIFDSFTQADASTTRKFGGTGLGLAISRRLVEMMDGKMWVKSEFGTGSTFFFTVVMEQTRLSEEDQPKAGIDGYGKNMDMAAPILKPLEGIKLSDLPSLRILLADDTEHNVSLIQMMLKKAPFTIVTAANGREAWDLYRQETFDLVLMDIEMPEMDGYEATRKIRQWEKENTLPAVPIIALTAHALNEHKIESLTAGCDLHLTKPVKKGKLIKAILSLTQASSQ